MLLRRDVCQVEKALTRRTIHPSAQLRLMTQKINFYLDKFLIIKFLQNFRILRKRVKGLTKYISKKRPAKGQRNCSEQKKTGTTLSSSTSLNERPKCVEIGKCTRGASSVTLVLSHMENMNWWKSLIFHLTIKPSLALNFTPPVIVPTEIDVSSSTLSTISTMPNHLLPSRSYKRTSDYLGKGKFSQGRIRTSWLR